MCVRPAEQASEEVLHREYGCSWRKITFSHVPNADFSFWCRNSPLLDEDFCKANMLFAWAHGWTILHVVPQIYHILVPIVTGKLLDSLNPYANISCPLAEWNPAITTSLMVSASQANDILLLRAQGFGERKGFSTASPVYVKNKQHKPRYMNSSIVRTYLLAQ
jgi:hypothetical protein